MITKAAFINIIVYLKYKNKTSNTVKYYNLINFLFYYI